MNIIVNIINAFVDGDRGGNPAGVVFDAEGLTQENKQLIAAQVGVSETVFVSPSIHADFKLEFFTPNRQIADCGHATIATFSYLMQQGSITGNQSSKEILGGVREILFRGDMAFMEQTAPVYTLPKHTPAQIPASRIMDSLGLTIADLIPGLEPIVVNTGVNCLVVPLPKEELLTQIVPDFPEIESVSRELDLIEYYVFSPETRTLDRDAGTRMFAPLYGIPEESATGMAAGPLACYLYDYLDVKKSQIIIEQGCLMTPPSPSELIVELIIEAGKISKLMVGGRAIVSRSINIEID